MNLVYKIIIAIVAFVVIGTLISPLLIGILPPFGLIVVVLLYVGVLAWLIGLVPLP
jgi:hypothetical protein